MSLVAALIVKDLRRRIASPAGVLLNLAIPIAIAGTMALAFSGYSNDGKKGPILRIAVVDLDKSPLSNMLAGSSQNSEASKYLETRVAATREEGLKIMRDEDLAAMLVIPQGFGDALLGGNKAELVLVKNPSLSIMPVVAQQGAEVVALYASAGSRLLGADAGHMKDLVEGKGWDDAAGTAAMITAVYGRIKAADNLLFPPIIEVKTEKASGGTGGGFNFLSWMYPGVMIMGLLFVGILQMRDLLREREGGTLRRQLTSPATASQILVAKVLSVAIVVGVTFLIFAAVGSIAFSVHWGAPGPFLSVAILIVLAVTGFSALLFSMVRTERQGDAIGGILVMLMSLLGGSFVPPQLLPAALGSISLFTVNYWGQEALRALATGGGWDQVAAHTAILAAMAVVFTGAGMMLLARRHMRGAL